MLEAGLSNGLTHFSDHTVLPDWPTDFKVWRGRVKPPDSYKSFHKSKWCVYH